MSTPLTRESLFSMMQAYKTTSLLKAAIELDVFAALGERASAAHVAAAVGADPRGTRILLNALAALRVVGTDGAAYWPEPGVAELLVPSSPGYAGDMVHVFASTWEWDAFKRLSEAVRKGGTVMDEHAETPGYTYWEDFAAYAPVVAKPTAEVLANGLAGWAGERDRLHVLDLACGHGVYGYTVARAFPQARVWSLDWPNVLQIAERHAVRLGVRERTELLPGDMFERSLGGPYDLVLITNVLHHFAEDRAIELLRRAQEALRPGGRLGVVGFTTTDALPADDPAPHLFSVLMLAWTFEGEVHSSAAYERMYTAAGFTPPEVLEVPRLPFRVMIASRP